MIFFLNGASSAGKTQIAKALQQLSPELLLRIGIDTFYDMMPAKLVDYGAQADQGIQFTQTTDDKGPLTTITCGPFGKAIVVVIPQVVALLAHHGFGLIIDEVLIGSEDFKGYQDVLKPYPVHWIGVTCDYDVLLEREKQRGDRSLGLARAQFDTVHQGKTYDLTVDTTHQSPEDCAQQILGHFRH
jgi:chloramphenicol 3-O phosphotransferase